MQAFLDASIRPGHIFLNERGRLLSTAEYQSYPSARGHARPDVLKCLLAMTPSGRRAVQQMMYSFNTWVIVNDSRDFPYFALEFARRSSIYCIQLEWTLQVTRRYLWRSPLSTFLPWTMSACQVSEHRWEVRDWLQVLDRILATCRVDHLVVVMRNCTIRDQLRRKPLLIKSWEGGKSRRRTSVEFSTSTHDGHDSLWAIMHSHDCRFCKKKQGASTL